MKVHVQTLLKKVVADPLPEVGSGLCHTYDVSYDPNAADRAFELMDDLLLDNYAPCTIVAGLRAYLSLYVRTLGQERNLKNATELWIMAQGGAGGGFRFDGFKVELDMATANEDDIRITCDMAGVVKRLESRR